MRRVGRYAHDDDDDDCCLLADDVVPCPVARLTPTHQPLSVSDGSDGDGDEAAVNQISQDCVDISVGC